MKKIQAITGSIRPSFLVLAFVCVFLGLGVAVWEEAQIHWTYVFLILVWAVLGHIAVNALNEYEDFKSGLDLRTTRTPFSGGSGTLPSNPELANSVMAIALIALFFDALISLYFAFIQGWEIIPLCLFGLLLIYAYSVYFVYKPFLCLIVPGLGFGTVIAIGSFFMLTGHFSWVSFTASLVPFFLVSNLLLLNQFPDVEADTSVGRRNFPIIIGRKASSLIYGAFLLGSYLTIIFGVVSHLFPITTLLGLFTIPLAIASFLGAYKYGNDIQKLFPSMGMNVVLNLSTPALMAVGFLISPILF